MSEKRPAEGVRYTVGSGRLTFTVPAGIPSHEFYLMRAEAEHFAKSHVPQLIALYGGETKPAPSSPASPTPLASALRNRLAELNSETTRQANYNAPNRSTVTAVTAARIEEVEAALRMVEGGAGHVAPPAGDGGLEKIAADLRKCARAARDEYPCSPVIHCDADELLAILDALAQALVDAKAYSDVAKMWRETCEQERASLPIISAQARAKAMEEAMRALTSAGSNTLNYDASIFVVKTLLALKDRPHD